MTSHIVGYPCMGPKRELKFARESFWDGKSRAEELQKVAADLRSSIWKQMIDASIKYIPSNTFSYYDQVLDTTAMLGVVGTRYNWNGGEIGFDIYFYMGRGNACVPAMEMTKWFDTNQLTAFIMQDGQGMCIKSLSIYIKNNPKLHYLLWELVFRWCCITL